jgi:hypothetical protein
MYAVLISMPPPADMIVVTEFEFKEAAEAAVKAIAEIAPRAQVRIIEDAPPEVEKVPEAAHELPHAEPTSSRRSK